MSRSVRGRPSSRGNAAIPEDGLRSNCASGRDRYDSIRVIGKPITVTLPRLRDIRPRYCSRSDDRLAAVLALGMVRLNIARLGDWNGSAVDFISKALARFCWSHGLDTVSRVFQESSIRMLDEILEQSEYERSVSGDREPSSRMFLMVDYDQSAMVQIGPTLSLLHGCDKHLPAAFYQVFATSLRRWMRVYDVTDAESFAEDQKAMLDEEELEQSFYPKVDAARPAYLRRLPTYKKALQCLRRSLPKCRSMPRIATLIRLCLELDAHGNGFSARWPYLLREEIPDEMDTYVEYTDPPGPGALIVMEEDDLIEACFTEEMQFLGQELPIGSTLMLLIDLDSRRDLLDRQIKSAFDYLAAMLRSLSSATKLIEMIREVHDEHLRECGLEQGVHTQESAACVR